MSDILVLTVLKFAGVAIVLATTIWGMTQKTTFEDEAGRKRLTPSGHVAVALALGSFLVAGASQGFETLARQAEEASQAREKAEKAAREFRTEQRDQRSLSLQELSRAQSLSQAAEARAARAEQRILAFKSAQEQRERDLALSRDVNQGSMRNLARARLALSQLERLMQPIDGLKVTIEWATILEPSSKTLLAIKSAVEQPGTKLPPGLTVTRGSDGRIRGVRINEISPYYKRLPAFGQSYSYLCFFAHGTDVEALFVENPFKRKNCPRDAGLALKIATERGAEEAGAREQGLYVDLVCRTVSPGVVMKTEVDPTIDKRGDVASVVDLQKATVVLNQFTTFDGAHLTPTLVTIHVSGRRYELYPSEFTRRVTHRGENFFVAKLRESLASNESFLPRMSDLDPPCDQSQSLGA